MISTYLAVPRPIIIVKVRHPGVTSVACSPIKLLTAAPVHRAMTRRKNTSQRIQGSALLAYRLQCPDIVVY